MHPDDITLDALDPLRLDVGWDTRAEVLARLVALADEELIGADRQRALAGIVVAHRRLHRVLEEQSPLLAEPEEFDETVAAPPRGLAWRRWTVAHASCDDRSAAVADVLAPSLH